MSRTGHTLVAHNFTFFCVCYTLLPFTDTGVLVLFIISVVFGAGEVCTICGYSRTSVDLTQYWFPQE